MYPVTDPAVSFNNIRPQLKFLIGCKGQCLLSFMPSVWDCAWWDTKPFRLRFYWVLGLLAMSQSLLEHPYCNFVRQFNKPLLNKYPFYCFPYHEGEPILIQIVADKKKKLNSLQCLCRIRRPWMLICRQSIVQDFVVRWEPFLVKVNDFREFFENNVDRT